MASQITNYQCPACTGPLHYVGSSDKLECDYCGSSYSIPEIEKLIDRPLKITQPEDEMLVMPEKYRGLSSARASGIHRAGTGGGSYGGGYRRRSFGQRGGRR